MPLTLEINYFNSYFLKKLQNVPSNVIEVVNDTWTGPSSNPNQDWYIEESRIRGGYNNTSTDLGVKAYIVEEQDKQTRRGNTLIYSGIFNSRTGVNKTNQFSVAEEITRSPPRSRTNGADRAEYLILRSARVAHRNMVVNVPSTSGT